MTDKELAVDEKSTEKERARRKLKFDAFLEKRHAIFKMWHDKNGKVPAPVRFDTKIDDWVWMNRKQRRSTHV